MKKLLLLFLVLCGGVSTVSAKTIYFVDNWGRSDFKLYAWTGGSNTGDIVLSPISYVGRSNGYGGCYALNLGDYENFLIKHNEGDGRTQTVDLVSADYTDGEYYEFLWDGKETIGPALFTTYNFTVTTKNTWSKLFIWIWNSDDVNMSGAGWPGMEVSGSENVYNYSFMSYVAPAGILFNQGDGQPQTCNMTLEDGNKYYIASVAASKIDGSWGESVKTNNFGYATYVSNKILTIPTDIAYYATDNGNGSATAHSLKSPAASTPMLIKGAASTIYHFATAASSTDDTSSNAFHAGSGSAVSSVPAANQYNYILNGDVFKAANGKTVATNKAYLQLSQEATGASRILIFEDETTGINVVTTEEHDGDCYNLQGIKVANPTKGLYIRNGKKYIAK